MAKSGLKHIDVGNELTKTEWESEESHELVHGSAFPGTPVERQLFYRDDEHKWYIYNGSAWVWLGGGSGSATTFLQLTDTPASYEGHAGKVAQVKATEDGLEFSAAAGGMAVHGNEYHDPDFEQAGVAASLIASHAAIDDAHHSRYTDAEAEAVAEAEVESHRTTEVHTLAQPPQAHKTSHQNGGADEISLEGLSGESAELASHKGTTTGVHGVGASVVCSEATADSKISTHAGNASAHHSKTTDASELSSGELPTARLATNVKLTTITFAIDGGGSAITAGQKGHLEIPFACTINQVTMLANASGSVVVDIWKDTYANFPPTDADSITASAPPTITAAQKSQDSTLTGWTKSITAGDILAFNVDSCATIARVTISLKVTKT